MTSSSSQHERIGELALRRTRAYGKLILFGEHFVVYHVPALVGAVSAYTDCECEFITHGAGAGAGAALVGTSGTSTSGLDVEVVDDRPAVPGYKVEKKEEADHAIALVLKHFGLDQQQQQQKIKLTFGGTLTCSSGIGASAAQVVSLARAIGLAIPKELSLDDINAAGYEGEKGYHGTPSGIDNTAATFGGVLKFQKTFDKDGNNAAPIFTKKQIAEPIRIVYASTGITASTIQVVGDVKAKKEKDPEWFDGLLQRYMKVVNDAEVAIDTNDLEKLGSLINDNHVLCQELTVSCKELDDLVLAAREAGALGAKMSGTGRGGLMLALTPTDEIQTAVAEALKNSGASHVWKTTFA